MVLAQRKIGEVQSDIFGTICASSKDGENVPQPDTCAQIPWPKLRKHCYQKTGKKKYNQYI